MSEINYRLWLIGWLISMAFVFGIKGINYYFKRKSSSHGQTLEELPTLAEINFPSSEVFVYEGMAYWLEEGKLYRAKHQDVVHVNTKEHVDPLNQKEITVDEYMSILAQIETRRTN